MQRKRRKKKRFGVFLFLLVVCIGIGIMFVPWAMQPENFREVKKETYQGKVIAKDYTFPKRFLSVRTKDIKRNLTDEQRKEISDQMKTMRAKRKTDSMP